MSSGCGLSSSSSSIFGLCSGNNRRPSMFTAKYRLREERKKVLKLSMNKVKRIEDPESFLRRSVLINNTIKRLQREVREEKMMRSGGYTSKLHSMHSSFRKSFASSRLSEMHFPSSDEMLDDPSPTRSSAFESASQNLILSADLDLPSESSVEVETPQSRKRPLSDEDDCDVHAVLSQIYSPPTPCIISSLDDEDCCDSASLRKKPRLTPTEELILSGSAGELCCSASPLDDVLSSSSHVVVDDVDVDVDIDVDVVGDGDSDDWSAPQIMPQCQPVACDPIVVDPEDVISEFTLDLHLSSPGSESLTTGTVTTSEVHDTSSDSEQQSSGSGSEDEDIKSSSDSKENTCALQSLLSPSSCCTVNGGGSALLSSTMTDLSLHHNKCSSHQAPNHNNNVMMINSNASAATSPGSEAGTGDKQSQYSSCGHSSIFGELQSVVFHSLIASLET